jgi:hypothetical protein
VVLRLVFPALGTVFGFHRCDFLVCLASWLFSLVEFVTERSRWRFLPNGMWAYWHKLRTNSKQRWKIGWKKTRFDGKINVKQSLVNN